MRKVNNSGSNNPMYGKHHSEETKQKMRLVKLGKKMSSEFLIKNRVNKLGSDNGMYGRHQTLETRMKMMGENHYGWKGDDVGYAQLHEWIRKYLPMPKLCEICNQEKKLDAACVTGIYNREFINWKYLCRSCHWKNDGIVRNFKK